MTGTHEEAREQTRKEVHQFGSSTGRMLHWEPAIVVNQYATNSYWIMQENGTKQPKVHRCTRTMLKIRSTPTAVKRTEHMKDYPTEIRKSESSTSAISNTARDSVHKNSLENISPDLVQLTLPRLDLPHVPFDSKSEDRGEIAESLCTDGTATLEMPDKNEGNTPYTPGSCKSTRRNFGKPASSFSDFYM